jgi:hypothetical protein
VQLPSAAIAAVGLTAAGLPAGLSATGIHVAGELPLKILAVLTAAIAVAVPAPVTAAITATAAAVAPLLSAHHLLQGFQVYPRVDLHAAASLGTGVLRRASFLGFIRDQPHMIGELQLEHVDQLIRVDIAARHNHHVIRRTGTRHIDLPYQKPDLVVDELRPGNHQIRVLLVYTQRCLRGFGVTAASTSAAASFPTAT